MFEVKAGTLIDVTPKIGTTEWHVNNWIPYTTKETKLYDKHEVYDRVSVHNDKAGNIPYWIRRNVLNRGMVVLSRNGKFALVNACDITFLD